MFQPDFVCAQHRKADQNIQHLTFDIREIDFHENVHTKPSLETCSQEVLLIFEVAVEVDNIGRINHLSIFEA